MPTEFFFYALMICIFSCNLLPYEGVESAAGAYIVAG
jgi:hypothetical protein